MPDGLDDPFCSRLHPGHQTVVYGSNERSAALPIEQPSDPHLAIRPLRSTVVPFRIRSIRPRSVCALTHSSPAFPITNVTLWKL